MIDYIIYINLDEKIKKKEHMETMLSKFNIPYQRFPGFKPPLEECLNMKNVIPRIREYLYDEIKYPRGIGVLGCYLSHITALNICKKLPKQMKHMLLLEDDVIFSQEDLDYINNILTELTENHDWDILRVLLPRVDCYLNRGVDKVDNLYKFTGNNVSSKFNSTTKNVINGGCHFYIINRKNISKINRYIKKENIFNIDSVYSTNELNVFFLISNSILSEMRDDTSIPKL